MACKNERRMGRAEVDDFHIAQETAFDQDQCVRRFLGSV
jgi:hypothetical protein